MITMLFRGFWDNLEKPIVGLAPMDGVTDAAFRHMVCKYGKPSFTMTEFANVEGLARGNVKKMVAFLYDEIERPVVGQIFGAEPRSFYKAAVLLSALGFDGIDINMGCPARKVERKGCGAGLIQNPGLAKELVRVTKQGVKDWAEGITLEKAGIHPDIIKASEGLMHGNVERKGSVRRLEAKEWPSESERKPIPVSVKTRIGYDKDITEEWTKHLLEVQPANISMHGRTLKQMYIGRADWDSISKAAKICHGSGTTLLGNGDIESMEDARNKIETYGVDGVLVGRATLGNPWFFIEKEPTNEQRLRAALDHSRYFEELGVMPFHELKKHLASYCKGFDGARDLRKKLMEADSFGRASTAINAFIVSPHSCQ